MASGLATLKAVMVIAVFAMLAMPSLGHKRTGPLCSDCKPLCAANCTAFAAKECGTCGPPPGCDSCMARYVQQHCPECCYNHTCSCNDCNIGGACIVECRSFEGVCRACQDAVGGQCNSDCNSACNNKCVKKGKGC